MKCIRVIEYEAESEKDLETHLKRTLLSKAQIVRPGAEIPGIGRIFGDPKGPMVTIRLIEERWE